MHTKYFTRLCAVLLAVMLLSACERAQKDTRTDFVGDYSFVSKGSIDLYAGSLKLITIPMDRSGEMTISPGDDPSHVWVVASGDSTLGHVSGKELFMDPTTDQSTYGNIVMDLSFKYGKATLKNDMLSWATDVEIMATYMSQTVSGVGTVDIVATKK